jgi:hypothetical protein
VTARVGREEGENAKFNLGYNYLFKNAFLINSIDEYFYIKPSYYMETSLNYNLK